MMRSAQLSGSAKGGTISGRRALEMETHSPEETLALGRRIGQRLQPPCLVALEGELGSGKTTLTKGIVAGLGAAREEEVTSPTFTLVHEYGSGRKVFHVDLYRVEGTQELATLGLDDLFDQDAVVIVEWPEKLGELFHGRTLKIKLEHLESESRKITIEGLDE